MAKWLARYRDARAAGDLAAARRAAINAKKAAPRAPDAREALGLAAYALGDWHEAAMELTTWRRFTGARTHDPLIAEVHMKRGRADRALELLDDLAHGSVPEEIWARAQVVRADAMIERGNADLAGSILRTAARVVRTPQARAVIGTAIDARPG